MSHRPDSTSNLYFPEKVGLVQAHRLCGLCISHIRHQSNKVSGFLPSLGVPLDKVNAVYLYKGKLAIGNSHSICPIP
jgi:hypothetical protein